MKDNLELIRNCLKIPSVSVSPFRRSVTQQNTHQEKYQIMKTKQLDDSVVQRHQASFSVMNSY